MRRIATGLASLACAVALAAPQALADLVVLKNGRVIGGGEAVVDGDRVKLSVPGGTVTFSRDDVARIVKTEGPVSPAGARRIVAGTRPQAGGGAGAAVAPQRPPTEAERQAIIEKISRARARAGELMKQLEAAGTPKDEADAYAALVSLDPFPTTAVGDYLRSRSVKLRLVAARAIGRAGDGAMSSSLVNAALSDPDAGMRRAAARAIAEITPRDRRPLNVLAESAALARTPRDVERAAEAVRAAGYREVVGYLINRAILDVRMTSTQAASMSTASISAPGSPGVLELPMEFPTVAVTQVKTTVELPVGVPVLEALTGQRFGGDVSKWADWWRRSWATYEL